MVGMVFALENMIYTYVSLFFTMYLSRIYCHECIVFPWLKWNLDSFYLAGKVDVIIPHWMDFSWMVTVILSLFGNNI